MWMRTRYSVHCRILRQCQGSVLSISQQQVCCTQPSYTTKARTHPWRSGTDRRLLLVAVGSSQHFYQVTFVVVTVLMILMVTSGDMHSKPRPVHHCTLLHGTFNRMMPTSLPISLLCCWNCNKHCHDDSCNGLLCCWNCNEHCHNDSCNGLLCCWNCNKHCHNDSCNCLLCCCSGSKHWMTLSFR